MPSALTLGGGSDAPQTFPPCWKPPVSVLWPLRALSQHLWWFVLGRREVRGRVVMGWPHLGNSHPPPRRNPFRCALRPHPGDCPTWPLAMPEPSETLLVPPAPSYSVDPRWARCLGSLIVSQGPQLSPPREAPWDPDAQLLPRLTRSQRPCPPSCCLQRSLLVGSPGPFLGACLLCGPSAVPG